MSTSTLIAHSPKFAAKLVTLAQLKKLPEPEALGLRHKPIPHHRLIEGIAEEVKRRDYEIKRQQFALAAKGDALFGVLDLARVGAGDSERGVSFGFRTSTNSTLAIKAVAGTRVFVCDNLALSGDMIAFNRKSTTLLDIKMVIAEGFDKFIVHEQHLNLSIEIMKLRVLSDTQAKEKIFDVFNEGVVPVRLFGDVSENYFKPTEEMPDCQPRSLWGLHNAFTRAMRDLTPVSLFNASMRLGRAFEMRGPVVEGEVLDQEEIQDEE